jgi:transposase
VRVTTAFHRLLGLQDITVRGVSFPDAGSDAHTVVVEVGLRRKRLACPLCGFTTRARYDTRPVSSTWRHLDFGRWQVQLRAGLRRLCCPTHGVRVEAVPFARAGTGFSRDFEDLVAFLATKTDKTTITRLSRVDWDSVGRICARVVADGLDPARLDGLVSIGVDEVSWKRHHHYLTLVADHTTKKIVWGAEGKDTATLDAFFDQLGSERAAGIETVSMDMGASFNKSVRAEGHAPQAVICIDPFHAVKLVTEALDTVRRVTWNELRALPDQAAAKKFKGARWALLKRPENLTDDQSTTLRKLRRRGGDLWRAYSLN